MTSRTRCSEWGWWRTVCKIFIIIFTFPLRTSEKRYLILGGFLPTTADTDVKNLFLIFVCLILIIEYFCILLNRIKFKFYLRNTNMKDLNFHPNSAILALRSTLKLKFANSRGLHKLNPPVDFDRCQRT